MARPCAAQAVGVEFLWQLAVRPAQRGAMPDAMHLHCTTSSDDIVVVQACMPSCKG